MTQVAPIIIYILKLKMLRPGEFGVLAQPKSCTQDFDLCQTQELLATRLPCSEMGPPVGVNILLLDMLPTRDLDSEINLYFLHWEIKLLVSENTRVGLSALTG